VTSIEFWAQQADKEERASRKRFIQSDGIAPLTDGWSKYNRSKPTIRLLDAWGREHWITEKQNAVLQAATRLQGRGHFTVTMVAASVGQAASSVSRTLLKLASFGLIAYDVKRGRYGGVEFIRVLMDELKARAQSAWERLKVMRLKAEARIWDRAIRRGYPAFGFNVASIVGMDATLTIDWEEYDEIIASEHAEARADFIRYGWK
jgi:hypothetical protein